MMTLQRIDADPRFRETFHFAVFIQQKLQKQLWKFCLLHQAVPGGVEAAVELYKPGIANTLLLKEGFMLAGFYQYLPLIAVLVLG